MRNPLHSPFLTVFHNEVLLNSKRLAPYALTTLFIANAVLWWSRPAVLFGWATNSDWYIVRNLVAFSFLLGLPIFNAVITGDPVLRDFRTGVDPLIFSKPVSRAQYLLGKFFGSFFVLVCCQAAFPVTQLVLQLFPTSKMIVQPFHVIPYFKHFIFFVVVPHLLLAAFYFTIGTLTRSNKIVYAAAICFYPLYISYGLLLLRGLPPRWQMFMDPMLTGATLKGNGFLHPAEFLNQYVVPYTGGMIANRSLMIAAAAICLLIVCLRFTINERTRTTAVLSIDLSGPVDRIKYETEMLDALPAASDRHSSFQARLRSQNVPLPEVATVDGFRANLRKLRAATGIELQLIRSEKSLLVLASLAVIISFLSLPFSASASQVSASAGFASASAKGTLVLLLGVIVFYVGEAMHRDREMRVEPGLWSAPAPNHVFLLSKFLATISLAMGLLLLIVVTAMLTQLLRGLPLEITAYLRAYIVIVVPGLVFICAVSIAMNVLLRDKYLNYVATVGAVSGLFYLYTQGYHHWLYNPLLVRLWDDSSLMGSNLIWILKHRLYVLALSLIFIALAHLAYPRRSFRRRSLPGLGSV